VIRSRASWLSLALGIAAGCDGSFGKTQTPPATPRPADLAGSAAAGSVAPPPPRSDGRLPRTVTPLRYGLSLHIDPSAPRFSGVASIQVEVSEPTSYVVLHARDMNIHSAVVQAGGLSFTATTSTRIARGGVQAEELLLTLPRPLPEGQARIEITYDAPFAADLAGLYRVEEAGRSYAYSQFEVADARRAFPCFDEPGFKTPYEVTIEAPRGNVALSNSPEISAVEGQGGMVLHRFAASPPLPSYLVAFAVGDFDIVEWQKDPFPIRAITTKGRGNLTSLALEGATSLVAHLGEYFDIPYPYAKLDLVAVPDFAAGGMENPGLITFRDALLLLDARRATAASRRAQAVVLAHELAHQWFGDLVTMEWWDDIWLNEGFATWAEAKVVDSYQPSFGATLEQIAGVQHVMDIDALKTARAVREPVRTKSEAEEAFDGLTYDKGAAVLRMIESWLGPDVFRRGVQRYLREHAWKNARAADLFHSLEFVSTQKVGQLAGGFLDQTGVPEVVTSWTCGTSAGNKLELSQSEWRPLGDRREPRPGWTLPVCIDSDVQKGRSCFTLGRELIVRELGANCPAWVHPNADGAGYYRFVLDAGHLLALARASHSLSAADRLGMVSNAWAEVRQGAIPPLTITELLPLLDDETNRYVVDQIVATLQGLDGALVDDDVRPAFRLWTAARLSGHKAALGWEPSPREEDDRTAMRRSVLWAMGEIAGDRKTLEEAEAYAARWLRDPNAVPADTALAALPLASMNAGAPRLAELRAAAEGAKTPEDRVLAIRSMGTFDDPAVLRAAFDLSLTPALKLSELRYLFGAAVGHRAARPVLLAWEKENWSKLNARLGGSFGRGMLVSVVGTLCTRAEREEAEAFFVPATREVEGIKRPLDEAIESAGLCVALREHGAAEIAKRFQRR
jgi:alanyl aminopeptidase